MPLVCHLRRMLAPFCHDGVGIDKSVFANGVCGKGPVVGIFVVFDGEEPLDRFTADELRCALIKIEGVALVNESVFLRSQAIGLVRRRGKFLERGSVFAATDCAASANEIVSNGFMQSFEVVREPQIVLIAECDKITFAKRYGLVEVFAIT